MHLTYCIPLTLEYIFIVTCNAAGSNVSKVAHKCFFCVVLKLALQN